MTFFLNEDLEIFIRHCQISNFYHLSLNEDRFQFPIKQQKFNSQQKEIKQGSEKTKSPSLTWISTVDTYQIQSISDSKEYRNG